MMAGHVNCRRAVRKGHVTWFCISCGRMLGYWLGHPARSGDGEGIHLEHGYVPLGERDGLPAYGPHDRIRLGDRSDSRGAFGPDRRYVLAEMPPIFVYCLNRQCGIGQHLH